MAEEPANPPADQAPQPAADTPQPQAAPKKGAAAKPAAEAVEPAATESPENSAPAAPATGEKPATPAPKKAEKSAKKASKKEAAAPEAASPANISLDDTIEPIKVIKAKGSKNVTHGIAHVLATFNNTIVSITDPRGGVLGWSSAGKCGFKGSRKSTAYAAQVVAQDACKQAMGHGVREVEVRVKGPGSGRESAVRAMQAVGLEISIIRDVTPIPHNGCRPPKQRRV